MSLLSRLNRIIRITFSISCLLLCVFWFGCRSGPDIPLNPTLEELVYSLKYEEVLSKLNGERWERETDPRTIMIYCEALVETKTPLPREMVSAPVPQHVGKFVHGY